MLNKLWTKVKQKILFDEIKNSAIISGWETEAAIKHKSGWRSVANHALVMSTLPAEGAAVWGGGTMGGWGGAGAMVGGHFWLQGALKAWTMCRVWDCGVEVRGGWNMCVCVCVCACVCGGGGVCVCACVCVCVCVGGGGQPLRIAFHTIIQYHKVSMI